jgi:di/tricarboxylate transporter
VDVSAYRKKCQHFISKVCRWFLIVVFVVAGLYGAVYLATFLISNIVTNNAAAALTFPVAMAAAEDAGADLVLMAYCVMLGASASFASPFGYQLSVASCLTVPSC